MKYAPFLKNGDTIGFVAPSFGCNIEPYRSAFENALSTFRRAGFHTDLGPNCYAGEGIGISNTPQKCGAELMEYYCSSGNDALISCGGGELMCEVLNYLDFETLKHAPAKWYMGYSDNTNMTFLLTTLADTASIYGPCAPAFGMEPWHKAVRDAFCLLTGDNKALVSTGYEAWEETSLKDEEHPLLPYQVTKTNYIHLFAPGCDERVIRNRGAWSDDGEIYTSFSGRLLGGCMDILAGLVGTRYDAVEQFCHKYKEDGIIWFMESCDLNVMAIRRAIWQLENAGWFQYVKGFLIGRPLCNGENMMGLDQYHAVVDVLEKYHVPIVMDLDIGHLPPMMPLICGSVSDVTVGENGIRLSMRLC